jgi:hypothetical protein
LVASPTPSSTSSSAHSLKKRLISEYELEQQRNSPVVQPTEEISNTPNVVETSKTETEEVPNSEKPDEVVSKPAEETENST